MTPAEAAAFIAGLITGGSLVVLWVLAHRGPK